MDISGIRNFVFDIDADTYPWIDPRDVIGIDADASKALYKKIWYGRRSRSQCQYYTSEEQTNPESDASMLFDYIRRGISSWINFKSDGEKISKELSEINTIKIIEIAIFFVHHLGYPMAGGILTSEAKLVSSALENKEIFSLYKLAFEEESEAHLKWCLQDNFLDFFGYLPVFENVHNKTNWSGLSEKDLSYLEHLHHHRMLVPGFGAP